MDHGFMHGHAFRARVPTSVDRSVSLTFEFCVVSFFRLRVTTQCSVELEGGGPSWTTFCAQWSWREVAHQTTFFLLSRLTL